jgi:Domain of unknown function (DUF4405)
MSKSFTLRSWSTPLTIGIFLLMSVTGILMFFEWHVGLVTQVHQWFSWLFLFAAGAHIIANFRPFKNHLNSNWGRTSVTTFAVLLAASLFTWGIVTGTQLIWPVELALVHAPLTKLADLTNTTPDDVVKRMKDQGISVTAHQSVHDIAIAHNVSENRLLGIVFLR